MRVLVTGSGGDVARGVISCIGQSRLSVKVITAGLQDEVALGCHPRIDYFLPHVDSHNYLDKLRKVIQQTQITHLIPCVSGEIQLIADAAENSWFGSEVQIFTNGRSVVRVFLDKVVSMQFLRTQGVLVPETLSMSDIAENSGYLGDAIIVKPRFGWGSREVHKISVRQFQSLSEQSAFSSEVVIQRDMSEFGFEFTAGVYVSPRSGIGRACILQRTLQHGRSWWVRRYQSQKIESRLIELSRSVGAIYLNFQGFINENEDFVIFEVNPRLSGSVYFQSPVMNVPEAWLAESTDRDYSFGDDPGVYLGCRSLTDTILLD